MFCHVRHACKLLVLAACIGAAGSAAYAADNTRYISTTGSNANACTLAAPCRTLHKGIATTPAGGELRILNAGFYGNNATINKSLTISGAGNTVYLGTDITINNAGAVVTLRGLTLNGQGTVVNSIDINAARAVHIERCVIHNYTGDGIEVTADDIEVFIRHSIVRDNAGNGFHIEFAGSSRVTIDNSNFDDNGQTGVHIASGAGAISRSTASGNGTRGIEVNGASVSVVSTMAAQNDNVGLRVASGGIMRIESSVASDNGTALSVASGSTAIISNSTLTGVNAISSNGTVRTRQNNTIAGAILGALTPLTPQ
jgi:hypothetical protein